MKHVSYSLQVLSNSQIRRALGRSFELSGFQSNALGRFSYLRPAVYYKGEGKAIAKDFKYKGL